jgi:hypothetical protein
MHPRGGIVRSSRIPDWPIPTAFAAHGDAIMMAPPAGGWLAARFHVQRIANGVLPGRVRGRPHSIDGLHCYALRNSATSAANSA